MIKDLLSKIDILKVAAHPVRIAILDQLSKGIKCVSDLEELLEISQPNLSQHLAVLKNLKIVDFFIDGRLRCYFLKNPLIPDLLEIIKNDYPDELPGPECCPSTKKGTYPGERQR